MNEVLPNPFIDISISNEIANKLTEQFESKLNAMNFDFNVNKSYVQSLYIQILGHISDFLSETSHISITKSNSLYFRFNSNNYQFNLEVFFDYDKNDESDIQSTLNIFYPNKELKSYYGAYNYLCSIINSLATRSNLIRDTEAIYNYHNYSTNRYYVPSKINTKQGAKIYSTQRFVKAV